MHRLKETRFQRTRGKNFKVLLKQGLKDRTLGERGSIRCFLRKASCSLLLPSNQLAQRQVKSRQESLKRGSVAKARLFHQTLKEKCPQVQITQAWDVLFLLKFKGTTSLREEERKSVAMALLLLQWLKSFSIRGHETTTYLCVCPLGF